MANNETSKDEIKRLVRQGYSSIARSGTSCCGPASACCGDPRQANDAVAKVIGYSDEDIAAVPPGANMGLGCGNPLAHAALQPGETVLDLGSGAGFDCFLAAARVGPAGHVIGVDMTPDMLERARRNAAGSGHANVEFRLGEIEHLPVADASIDVIVSNCVVNLSPDKVQVFREAWRVLKPGGRLVVSDIVLDGELPRAIRENAAAYVSCIAGAIQKAEYLEAMRVAGFSAEIVEEHEYPVKEILSEDHLHLLTGAQAEEISAGVRVTSVKVRATKQARPRCCC